MIASLPMYDRAEIAHFTQQYWVAIRKALADRGVESPEHLTSDGAGRDFWSSDDLLFSQTCGLPYRLGLHNNVTLIGTPNMQLEGCEPGYYRSAIVVRKNDTRAQLHDFSSATLAINGYDSQSGYAAIYNQWDEVVDFPTVTVSGSHLQSAIQVAQGEADFASLDAATWRQIQRFDNVADALVVLDWTDPTPTLPYITGASQNAECLYEAVQEAIDSMDAVARDSLGVHGLTKIAKHEYMNVQTPPLAKAAW